MKKNALMLAAMGCLLYGGQALAAGITSDAGADLNRTLELLERERVAQQIAEGRTKSKLKVEGTTLKPEHNETSSVTFELKKITTTPSSVLSESELESLTQGYLGKTVTVNDIYELVGKINELYIAKGYPTCRAFLGPQTIKEGCLRLTLLEGVAGQVQVINNKWTKASYIRKHLQLHENQLANVNKLNKDLLHFNSNHDVQLRIVMKAGDKGGTTDYVIEAYEPQQHNVVAFMDNGGNYSSGDFRTGLFYTVKSLSGERDALTIGTIRSEGSKAASVSYNRSLGHSGTRLNASYSGNSVRAVRSPSDSLGVVGHSYSYSIGLVQPVVVNEKTRSEVSFEYNWQGSKSELRKTEGNHLNHDKMHDGTLAFALTDYGRSHVFYQKHGLSYGKSKSLSNSSNDYLYYKFYGLYHKSYPRGQAINLRGEAQWSKAHEADELISSRQFYIGGAYSVRGFKESYMSGNSGYLFSAEYQVPVTKDRNTNAFVFYDYGHVYQSKESSNRERVLSSVGIGLKSKLTEKISASLSLGCPLKTEFAGKMDQVSKTRLNFMVSGQF